MCAVTRTRPDRCPGITRPWHAEDGDLLRVRLPGGRIDASALAALADIATEYGDGDLHLTSRANLQLRGVGDGPAAAARIAAAGLLPRPSHDLVRNIVCTPLTGLVGGLADLRPLLKELDGAVLADDGLAALPGKFLFLLDDGRGDVAESTYDLGAIARSADTATILIDGQAHTDLPMDDVVTTLIELAHRFLGARGEGPSAAWHARELAGGAATLAEVSPAGLPKADPPAYGVIRQDDGLWTQHHAYADGMLSAEAAREITCVADELIVTPWRGILAVCLQDRPKEQQ